MPIAEERASQGFARVEDVFAAGELEGIVARYKAVAGFSREAVSALGRKEGGEVLIDVYELP